jgi:hypothetical protein
MNNDMDFGAEAGHRFVHRIIHHFVDQVVEPFDVRIANIHGRTNPDCLKAFQNLYFSCVVLLFFHIFSNHP